MRYSQHFAFKTIRMPYHSFFHSASKRRCGRGDWGFARIYIYYSPPRLPKRSHEEPTAWSSPHLSAHCVHLRAQEMEMQGSWHVVVSNYRLGLLDGTGYRISHTTLLVWSLLSSWWHLNQVIPLVGARCWKSHAPLLFWRLLTNWRHLK